MNLYEQAVLEYVIAVPTRFVQVESELGWHEKLGGGSRPDFIVLDFSNRTIYVVEVSSAWDTSNLLQRARDREQRWLQVLRSSMPTMDAVFTHWRYHVTLFVRQPVVEACRTRLADAHDVSVLPLDDVLVTWNWKWDGQRALNPLELPA